MLPVDTACRDRGCTAINPSVFTLLSAVPDADMLVLL